MITDIVRGLEYIENEKYVNIAEFSAELLDNEELALELVAEYCGNYKYLSKRLRDNYRIATFALYCDSSLLEHMSDRIKDDDRFLLRIVGETTHFLDHVSPRLMKDVDFKNKIEDRISMEFSDETQYAGIRMISLWNYEVVYQKEEFVSLFDNYDFVERIIWINNFVYDYASDRLRRNRDLLKIYLETGGDDVEWIAEKYKNDYEILELFRSRYDLPGKYQKCSDPITLIKRWSSLIRGNGLVSYTGDPDLIFSF